MNEETPSQLPPSPPPFWLMVLLGIGLLFLSCFLCMPAQSPAPLFIAALGALVSVFFKGWRGLFVGFAGTIGVAILAVIVICGSSSSHF